jgi:hypothetical protein
MKAKTHSEPPSLAAKSGIKNGLSNYKSSYAEELATQSVRTLYRFLEKSKILIKRGS